MTVLYNRANQANLADILFTLCVNFLMYVLLILVFYMLVRFYLEEDLEWQDEDDRYAPLPRATDETSGERAGDDKSSALSSSSSAPPNLVDVDDTDDAAAPTVGGGELEMKSLSSVDGAAQNEPFTKMDMNTASGYSSSSSSSSSAIDTGHDNQDKHSGTFLNINDWGEPEGTKQEVIQRAIVCAIGLNVTFCIWGLIQERMLTKPYDDDFFEYSYGLVFLNRLGGLILSFALVKYFNVQLIKTPLWEYAFPSVTNMLSSWCQYEALKYVSFPTQMLAKAFKMVPVMLMGTFMHNKVFESYEYISATCVGFGLYLFINSSEKIDLTQNVFGDPETVTGAWCGVVLLSLFLAFDSFTSQWQTRMFHLHKSMSPLQMMLIMNGFSSVFSLITLIHQEELSVSLNFFYKHPIMVWHVLLFTVASTIGQVFIFYTVKSFGAVVFSIIMSIRILLSTLLSCYFYDHAVTELGVVGMIIVFGSIAYRIRRKTDGKPLIRWTDRKVNVHHTRRVFSDWHEHLDDC